MTNEAIRHVAQSNPVRALTSRLGEETELALTLVDRLSAALRDLDKTCELLNQHGLPQLPDLGEIGNAAARARRALIADEADKTYVAPIHRVA